MADKSFNHLKPEVDVTNPLGVGGGRADYPRHLHHEDGSYVVVTSDAERDAKVAEGYLLSPFVAKDEPKKPVDKKK